MESHRSILWWPVRWKRYEIPMEVPVAAASKAANPALLFTTSSGTRISVLPRARKFFVDAKSSARKAATPENSRTFSRSQNGCEFAEGVVTAGFTGGSDAVSVFALGASERSCD